jgi:hypothetical protein
MALVYKYADDTIGTARQVNYDETIYPSSYMTRRGDRETEAEWIARLASIGITPVRYEQPEGFDPNTMDKGVPVGTLDADGWWVITWPEVAAKVAVWSTETGDLTYISSGADIPDGYTAQEPPDLLPGMAAWDDAAGAWVDDVEAMATAIRDERDARLTACDWTQLPDSPLTPAEQAEYAAYRQSLRDLTDLAGFPWQGDVSAAPWPSAPGMLG